MRNLLLVDFNNVMFQSIAVHQHFTHEDYFTGGIYGWAVQIAKLTSQYDPEYIVVCDDAPPYERKKRFPEYKGNRVKNEDPDFWFKMQDSRRHITEFCELLNIPIWSIPGLECDDLTAHACIELHDKFDRIIIKSNDDDAKQMLIYDNVFFFKQKALYGQKEFLEEFPGCTPEMWLLVKALTGTHNAVPGIKGVGDKTAIKILNDPVKLEKYQKDFEQMIERNLQLIELPCPFLPVTEDVPLVKQKYNHREMVKFMNKLGIDYTNYMREGYER
jgi:DNA polymerase-1